MIHRKVIPGVVSTEVNAKLSFNTGKTLEKARKIIKMYDEMGIKKERILVKIAGTWEGIQAAKMYKLLELVIQLSLLDYKHKAFAAM